jgi:hypothetical protein
MDGETPDYAEMLLKAIFGGQAPQHEKFDVERVARFLAAATSAQLFMNEFPKTTNYLTHHAVLTNALKYCSIEGLMLEFGVASGGTIKLIAATTEGEVHGFDSFQGLPEDWSHFQKAGRYSTGGKLPDNLPSNVKLHVGWFNDTLPQFLQESADDQKIRFLHVDSDIYSSAKTVLDHLSDKITAGTVIVFDDFFNYPNWENGESKAWREFVTYKRIQFEYIGWASRGSSLAVRINSVAPL